MATNISLKNMDNLRDLIVDINKYLDTDNNKSGTSIISDLTVKISDKVNKASIIDDTYRVDNDIAYSILAFLSFVQTFFASRIKATHYKDPEAVKIYWDAVALKDYFRT